MLHATFKIVSSLELKSMPTTKAGRRAPVTEYVAENIAVHAWTWSIHTAFHFTIPMIGDLLGAVFFNATFLCFPERYSAALAPYSAALAA